MLEIIKNNSQQSIIVFIHGFIGGKDTWMDGNKPGNFIKSLCTFNKIEENFDLGVYTYFTKITDIIEDVSWFGNLIGKKRKIQKNLPVNDISDMLQTEVQERLRNYTNIILVAHSMGGLVAKSTILKLIEENDYRIKLYVSLAVPHNGANLANIGKVIFGNPQINNLAPLETFINELNKNWLSNKYLPDTAYIQGKLDRIVPKASSIGYDSREIKVSYVEEDHFSITKPNDENDTVIISVLNLIEDLLEKQFVQRNPNSKFSEKNNQPSHIKNISNSNIVTNSNVNNSFNKN